MNETGYQIGQNIPEDLITYIQAQARQAYFKANRNAGLEVEDFVSLGLDILEKAKKTYNSSFSTKFNSYFTMLLKRDLYKASVKTHRKKRGGGGVKEDDIRRGMGERWNGDEESPKAVQHLTLTTSPEDGTFIQIAAPADNESEYQILVEQIRKQLPPHLHNLFKQMTDPDPELLHFVRERSKEKNRVVMTNSIVAEYLNIEKGTLRENTKQIQTKVVKLLGIDAKKGKQKGCVSGK